GVEADVRGAAVIEPADLGRGHDRATGGERVRLQLGRVLAGGVGERVGADQGQPAAAAVDRQGERRGVRGAGTRAGDRDRERTRRRRGGRRQRQRRGAARGDRRRVERGGRTGGQAAGRQRHGLCGTGGGRRRHGGRRRGTRVHRGGVRADRDREVVGGHVEADVV